MLRRLAALALAVVGLVAAPGCSTDSQANPASKPTSSHLPPVPDSIGDLKDATFFDHAVAVRPANRGRLRLSYDGYRNPRQGPAAPRLVHRGDEGPARRLLARGRPASFRFDRLDRSDLRLLPTDPKAATDPSSSVQLIDIDPTSPEHGQRHLLSVEWRETEGVYWQPDTLAFMPLLGFPLRPHTRYAVVVTDKVTAKDGSPIVRAAGLDQVLGLAPATGAAVAATTAAQSALAASLTEVYERRHRAATHRCTSPSFTTTDPTAELFAVRDALRKSEVACADHRPRAVEVRRRSSADYDRTTRATTAPRRTTSRASSPSPASATAAHFVFHNGKPVVQPPSICASPSRCPTPRNARCR